MPTCVPDRQKPSRSLMPAEALGFALNQDLLAEPLARALDPGTFSELH